MSADPGTLPSPRRLRLAWIGSPTNDGGVGGICRVYLRELARADIRLDIYSDNEAAALPELAGAAQNPAVRFFPFTYQWDWGAWYGRNRKVAFIVSFLKRLRSYRRLVDSLVQEHRREPYDAVIQFSQGELFRLGRYHHEIPILLFPCVHAAGELYWCRRESALAQRCESLAWRAFRDVYLGYRARLQRRDYHRARGVIGMSRRFNAWVQRDYGVLPDRLGVVYQPIDVPAAPPAEARPPAAPVRLLFVGRISVRKGIDLLLQAIPEVLRDDPGVEVTLIGTGSLWSNYEPLLDGFSGERRRWLRSLPNDQVIAEMRRSDVLLVPSWYEPGGIVVAEALANGMLIVSSDEVGSAENLPPTVNKEFRAGDVAGLKQAIAAAVCDVRATGPARKAEAAAIAREQFEAARIVQSLLAETRRLAATGP